MNRIRLTGLLVIALLFCAVGCSAEGQIISFPEQVQFRVTEANGSCKIQLPFSRLDYEISVQEPGLSTIHSLDGSQGEVFWSGPCPEIVGATLISKGAEETQLVNYWCQKEVEGVIGCTKKEQ